MALAGPRWRILAGSPVNAVGAAICRPENSAELPAGQCTPHFLFGLARKENGPYPQGVRRIRKRQSRQRLRSARSKRKGRLGALRCSGPPCARGSAYRCLLRFCLTFGHAWAFCGFCSCRPVADGADLVGVVVASSCFSFTRKGYAASVSGRAANGCAVAAAGCSSRERERQRGGRLRVSLYFPGLEVSPRAGRFRP